MPQYTLQHIFFFVYRIARCRVPAICVAHAMQSPQGEARTRPWDGHLSPAALQQLARLADELDLAKESQQLAWWLVGSRLASVDAEWIFSQLKNIQAALVDNTYTEEEKADLLHSLTLYIYSQIKRLKSLHTAFPGGCCKQLTFTLRSVFPESFVGQWRSVA